MTLEKLTKTQNKEFERLNNAYWKVRRAEEKPDVHDLMATFAKELDIPLFIIRLVALLDESDFDSYQYTDDAKKEIREELKKRTKELLKKHKHLDGEVVLPL